MANYYQDPEEENRYVNEVREYDLYFIGTKPGTAIADPKGKDSVGFVTMKMAPGVYGTCRGCGVTGTYLTILRDCADEWMNDVMCVQCLVLVPGLFWKVLGKPISLYFGPGDQNRRDYDAGTCSFHAIAGMMAQVARVISCIDRYSESIGRTDPRYLARSSLVAKLITNVGMGSFGGSKIGKVEATYPMDIANVLSSELNRPPEWDVLLTKIDTRVMDHLKSPADLCVCSPILKMFMSSLYEFYETFAHLVSGFYISILEMRFAPEDDSDSSGDSTMSIPVCNCEDPGGECECEKRKRFEEIPVRDYERYFEYCDDYCYELMIKLNRIGNTLFGMYTKGTIHGVPTNRVLAVTIQDYVQDEMDKWNEWTGRNRSEEAMDAHPGVEEEEEERLDNNKE